jgi:hypothetical protein
VSDRRWVWRVRGLLRDDAGRVLVLLSDAGAMLPYVEVEVEPDLELPRVRDALADLIAVRTIVVRPVARSVDEEHRVLEVAFELEAVGSTATALLCDWVGPSDLERFVLPAHDHGLLERLFADRPHPNRSAWARVGWFGEAEAWIDAELGKLGRHRTGPIEQLSSWCISSILRAPTKDGDVYFKATVRTPLFVDEGAVTRELAELFPGSVPRPLAIDSERRWMLLDDFGKVVGWSAPLETTIEVLTAFGRLQIEAADHADKLIAVGAVDRRPGWLAPQIASLLEIPDVLGLDEEELGRLEALVPAFASACERLAAGPVPDTLVHGDLHMANVARNGGRYVFFDWTDACVTHPFLDLIVLLFEDDPEVRRALRDAYLEVWAGYAAEDELLALWALAEPLIGMNQAVSYRAILESVEPGTADELAPMLPFYLRKAIAAENSTP